METKTVQLGSMELRVTQLNALDESELVARLAPVFDAMADAYGSDKPVSLVQMVARMAGSVPPEQWKSLIKHILATTVALVTEDGREYPHKFELKQGKVQIDKAFGNDLGLLMRATRAAIEVRLGNFTFEGLLGLEDEPELQEEPPSPAEKSSTSPQK